MSGSGTVIRHALELGHSAIGFDLDPLAILMSRVWTTRVADTDIGEEFRLLKITIAALGDAVPVLSWQRDAETVKFLEYWFHGKQRSELTKIAYAIDERSRALRSPERLAALDAIKVAFSRIIITKEQCASLARDTSHSRPHRVATESAYEVMPNFERSVAQLRKRLTENPAPGNATVRRGDARSLDIEDGSIDAVVTSPPYLNAIDYMRGHRMSLVWLGHSIPELRSVRSASIGAERSADKHHHAEDVESLVKSMRGVTPLAGRMEGVLVRYALDLLGMTSEVARVLRPGGIATFVIGNSCIKGIFVNNAEGVARSVQSAGMKISERRDRDLPTANRYLPVTGDSLSKRMRTETILICRKPKGSSN
ncbi:class I SAM-dependent methyltransferase [Mesorhizobium sp. M0491]|uniref:class I SAM-dependent methyltransferase n=1 Tax=Mesorhizobium sp. M0491 TaxID=2956950 RepID=UPI00333B0835